MLTGLDELPISINLWRTFMHWVGGMGVIVLVVAILPLLGIGGRQLYKAEVPTPMKDSSLTPRIAETAKGLWLTYVLLTVACGFSLWWVGLEPWDAVIHAFSVAGLGGFSNRDASLGHFDSVGVEIWSRSVSRCWPGSTTPPTISPWCRRSSAPIPARPRDPVLFRGARALAR